MEEKQGNTKSKRAEVGDKDIPHLAFFCLMLVALGLTAGAMIQLHDVHRAQAAWDNADAEEVGLEFKLGVLTYRKSPLS